MKKTENIKTDWNLELLYKNEKDPSIEKDMRAIESACASFEKKYKKVDFVSTTAKLLKALEDHEKLSTVMNGSKPWWYFALRNHLDSNDKVAGAKSIQFEQRLTNATNQIVFFGLAIAKIPKENQKTFLEDKSLQPFRYKLYRIFKNAQHNLSEKEEQLADLLSQTSYTMWEQGQSKVLNQKTIEFKIGSKKEILPLAKAMSILSDLPKKERRVLYGKIVEVLKSCSDFADSEINAIYNYKKIMDERRGYKKPYNATVLGYENDTKTVENLVALVTENFDISKRFYKLHAKLLKEKKIVYADKNTKIGEIKKKFNFEASVKLVRDTFEKIDPKYAKILDEFVKNGQIDVYPKKGKAGGAFCWSTGQNPVYVLLNHTDNIRSVETLAHEMGHAIHNTLSKFQPPRYSEFSMSTAEVASTFFEQAVGAELEERLSEKEKIIYLHNKIMGDITTVFRQIACFNFELELHTQIREKGMVDKIEIADMMAKHMRVYLGNAVEVTQDDGYTFVSWSHIRNFFYVYSYAFGQLISKALYEKWKADPSYAKKIEQFLSAGRSMSPEDIFKSVDIDVTNPEFFKSGLESIEKDIERLEKLAKTHSK